MQIGWYLHRLRAMGFAELLHRVSERCRHLSDASFARRVADHVTGPFDPAAPLLPHCQSAPMEFKEQLREDAARLRQGHWRLFGWREVSVGDPPRWHQDPVGTYVAPQKQLAHSLNHRALPEGADVRTLWELSRWSEATRLAMHGWLNADTDAIATAQSWLEQWCEENTPGYGIHWTSPLEVGLRLINFTWFDALVRQVEDPAVQARQEALAQKVVPAHAAWIWRYKSFGSSANNHLLGELVGLLHAVKRWPALEKLVCAPAQLWQEIGQCVLDQFAPDGGNHEQALHYHLFAWEMAWHAARLMGANSGPVVERLIAAAGFFSRVVHPGEPWNYGDSDDAEVLPFCKVRHYAEGEWQAWMRGRPAGQTLTFWLGPPPSLTPAAPVWWLAPESGMTAWESAGWQLRLDASPLGFGSMAAHGHGDALHLSIWDGEQALVIDPGTGGYYGMKKERAALAAWEAHNGPQPVSGFQSPRRMGSFLWMDHHQSPQIEKASTNSIVARFSHENRVWQRRVTVASEHQIEVEDRCDTAVDLRVRWHLAPEVRVGSLGSQRFRLQRGQRSWLVHFENASTCTVSTSLASRRYGDFEQCPVIEITGHLTVKSVWSRG
ncbi:MAG TPA: heparinase II/III-family protein [Verrucomicrobium sp.]|nr:heparinase II/III-family protein [Verrucomicrobium sp.]